jgi:hypothetical protein
MFLLVEHTELGSSNKNKANKLTASVGVSSFGIIAPSK